MKPGDSLQRALILLDILQTQSDELHVLSMNDLIAELEERGMQADRRTIYATIRALQDNQYPIVFTRKKQTGYYLKHSFSLGEIYILKDAIESSLALGKKTTTQFLKKLDPLLSHHQKKVLQYSYHHSAKTENETVLHILNTLLPAIAEKKLVHFSYYDLKADKTKKYRKQGSPYSLVPYAIVSNQNRYYCVFYSPIHKQFANYRLDKMERVVVQEELQEEVPFSLDDWMRSSFHMFRGKPETITCRFDSTMANPVFDAFGTDLIIRTVTDTYFDASIRSSITPTLIAWLIQFQDHLKVLSPSSLTQQLYNTGKQLEETYRKEKNNE